MEDKEGLIMIKDGAINIKDPEGLGRYPRIVPGENVIVYVNDNKIDKEIIVTNKSKISLKKKETSATIEKELEISDNKLKAYLTLLITPTVKVRILDVKPANKVTINGDVVKEEYPKITEEEIINYLHQEGIVFGIKEDVATELVKTKKKKKILIAEGLSPKEGENAQLVPVKLQKKDFEEAFNYIDSFSIGEVIAVKKPPIPGQEGKNIFGETIEPPPVKDIKIITGEGVTAMENDTKVIAVKNGMPKIMNKRHGVFIKIVPQYIIAGDIDKYTGNLKFEGDLLVTGNINDYFDVKVGNNLKVKGNIANSIINASGSVLAKHNIIACNITAGIYFSKKIKTKLKLLIHQIDDLLAAINTVIGEATNRLDSFQQNYQIGRVIRLLLNNKFRDIIPLIKEIRDYLEGYPSNLSSILFETLDQLVGYKKLLKLQSTDIFVDLNEKLKDAIEVEKNAKNNSNVYTNYLQSSKITASGDVIIKRGCYNSYIYGGNNIIVWGKGAFIKGGYYSAENYIYVTELGSYLSPINLDIGKGFFAKEIEGTVIISSTKDKYKIETPRQNLHIKVTNEGKIKEEIKNPNMETIYDQLKFQFIPPVKGGKH